MPPPYSLADIKTMIPNLEGEEIETLRAKVNEERANYAVGELVEIYQLIMIRIQELWEKEKKDPGTA